MKPPGAAAVAWPRIWLVLLPVSLISGSASALAVTSESHSAMRAAGAMDKVVQMLSDMLAKAQQEMQDEKVAFGKFSTWCSQETSRLESEVKEAAQRIEETTAEIGKLTSDASALQEDIGALQKRQVDLEADMKTHTKQRAEEHKEFLKSNQDLQESVSALERAILVLEEQNYDRKATTSGSALVQLNRLEVLPLKVRSMVAAQLQLMQEDPDYSTYSAPEANAYEFQSTSIIDVLKRLLSGFKDKKAGGEKEEAESNHAYKMVMMDLQSSLEEVQHSVKDKTATMNEKSSKAGALKGEVAAVAAGKQEDEKLLTSATTECEEKKLSFDEKQTLREQEQVAIKKAIEILSSEEASGNAEKYLKLYQGGPAVAGTSLVQLNAEDAPIGLHHRVRQFISDEASRLHSKSLAMLAEKLQADPFAKVRKLISAMIDKLMDEAHADAEQEGFCDKEMGKSKLTRTRLQEEVDNLKASIEEGEAAITGLSQEIAKLMQEVADLEAMLKEASEARAQEKAKNAKTVEDAEKAAAAVQRAVAVLEDFYSQAQGATAFVQTGSGVQVPHMGSEEWKALANPAYEGTVDKGHKKGMQTFGATYGGMQEEAGGVLALLEVIASDFSKLKADTESAEAIAKSEHEELVAETTKSKAVKQKAISLDSADKSVAEEKLHDDTEDLKLTEGKLTAAERYHAGIEDQCVDKGMTFEERQAARQAEIASLKEALSLLSSEA